MGDKAASAQNDNALCDAVNAHDLEVGRLRAKLPAYKRRIVEANRIIEEGLSVCQSPYVACSFGKDSAVMLHLVLQHNPDVHVRFLRWRGETDLLGNYDEVIANWIDIHEINLQQVELHRNSIDGDAQSDRWASLERDSDGYIIGLRAMESKAREATLR